jgi:hypothetical protein
LHKLDSSRIKMHQFTCIGKYPFLNNKSFTVFRSLAKLWFFLLRASLERLHYGGTEADLPSVFIMATSLKSICHVCEFKRNLNVQIWWNRNCTEKVKYSIMIPKFFLEFLWNMFKKWKFSQYRYKINTVKCIILYVFLLFNLKRIIVNCTEY